MCGLVSILLGNVARMHLYMSHTNNQPIGIFFFCSQATYEGSMDPAPMDNTVPSESSGNSPENDMGK